LYIRPFGQLEGNVSRLSSGIHYSGSGFTDGLQPDVAQELAFGHGIICLQKSISIGKIVNTLNDSSGLSLGLGDSIGTVSGRFGADDGSLARGSLDLSGRGNLGLLLSEQRGLNVLGDNLSLLNSAGEGSRERDIEKLEAAHRNVKQRELSSQILEDSSRNIVSVSKERECGELASGLTNYIEKRG
jgi:hypothetical protein